MSFQLDLDPREEVAAQLIADVGEKLREAFALEKENCGLSLRILAERLGRDRSHVHRSLSGFNNMTLRTLAELAWAMDREVDVNLLNPRAERWNDCIVYSAAPLSQDAASVTGSREPLITSTKEADVKVVELDDV